MSPLVSWMCGRLVSWEVGLAVGLCMPCTLITKFSLVLISGSPLVLLTTLKRGVEKFDTPA